MRGIWIWIGAIVVGLATLLVVMALVGNSDRSDETVTAGEWAEGVCGAVGAWRGQMEAIVEDIRTPPSIGQSSEEPQSETPQGRTGFIREGLTRAVRATDTLVVAVDNTGTPETSNGDEAADIVSDWADEALSDLESAESSLDEEADDLEDSIEQLAEAGGAIATTLVAGRQTLREVAEVDPELATAFSDSSTCQELRQKEQSS